jgi:hypothetical protein
MFKVSVLYPKSDDSTFDMDYYREKHMAIGHFYFSTQEALQAGMGSPDIGEAMADVPNYTNVQPQIQISEVVE